MLRLFQEDLIEGLALLDRCPFLLKPLPFLPDDVKPLNSLCFVTGEHIHPTPMSFFIFL
jgi:hypothetical protein